MTYIIAIDGPSGSGKSTIAEELSKKLKIDYLNTGSMYRAVTKYFLDNDIKENDKDAIIEKLKDIHLDLIDGKVYLNKEDVSREIRSDLVTKNVSWVSANKDVREKLLTIQRQLAKSKSFILDGRDIATVVFPNAKYKIFLTASPRVRARRRYEQQESELSIDEIEKSIIARDEYDSTRKIAPLKKAKDAILIDNSNMSISQTLDAIISIMDEEDVL
ncbi:(d)CMP kinase [Anaerococcus tetradius]|uniref:Cytidylate kinase n=1 Tax=Anaerococcus tetradius TaxID=33036 RepID=A0A133KDS1_9FIRM|nr:(d)CMP kinase [Anaerococcus tetradius]KWZ77719.1 cytidylate kinase [Anaerococcus tetradius]